MTGMLRGLAAAAIVLLAACAGVATTRTAIGDGAYPIRMEARRTPLGVGGVELAPGVAYAGGLALHGANLHGLSDLKNDGSQAWAVSDFGFLVRFRIVLDQRGRLIGAGSADRRALVDVDGAPLHPKAHADAEGLARLNDGRLLVSFERDHRIWDFGVEGSGPPRDMRQPDDAFADNEGLEGLSAADPDGTTWLAMGESGGAWVCDPEACRALPKAQQATEDGYSVTGADRDPDGGWFVVQRRYAPPLDMRVRVRRMGPDGTLGPVLIALRPPASVDNFEGVAAVGTPSGTRLYLLSDDNANPLQQTLLLAFDVRSEAVRPVPTP